MNDLTRWALLVAVAGTSHQACALSSEGTLSPAAGGSGAAVVDGGHGGDGPATGGGGSANTGGSVPESCLDGVDNDGNGVADCADPACQLDYECVPEVPAGWSGYLYVRSETYPAPGATPCPDSSAPSTLWSEPGAVAACDPCVCGNLQGGSCSIPTLSCWWNSSSCSGNASETYAPGDESCHDFPSTCAGSCNNDQRCQLGQDSTLVGQPTCAASGGAATVGEMWGLQLDLCAQGAVGGGCGSGQVCLPRAPSPYDLQTCVSQPGAQACPGSWPNAVEAFGDGVDTRGCEQCGCDASSVACTGGYVQIRDAGCLGSGGASPVDVSGSACASVQQHIDNSSGSYVAHPGSVSGACSPTGGQPVGAVETSGPVTLCCL